MVQKNEAPVIERQAEPVMSQEPTIIIVPCFNEGGRLDPAAFVRFVAALPHVSFLLIDDGSTDETLKMLESISKLRPASFDVLSLRENSGKGEAVRCGMLHALKKNPRYVGYWDADLATPLEAIPEFIETLEGNPRVEIAIGARVLLLGRAIERNASRHYFGRIAATMVSLMLGLPVYDTQCGAKLFRVTPHLPSLFADPFVTRWVFDVEILARWLIASNGESNDSIRKGIVEIPLKVWRNVGGSKLRLRDFLRAPIDLGRVYLEYGRRIPRSRR